MEDPDMTNSIANAASRLGALADGTRLRIAMTGGQLTATAAGMAPIAIALPTSELVIGSELRAQLRDIVVAAADATPAGEMLAPDASFWLTATLLAAGESGISL
jgi:hypothetical protein